MAIDPELAAEMQRRGLSMPAAPVPGNGPSGYAADSGNQPLGYLKPIDPELAAEMQRRGLPVPQTMASRLKGMADSTANAAPTAGMMVGGSLGGAAGAAAGGVGAVPGAIAGAGAGGAAGSAYKRVYQYLTGARDPNQDTALGNAGDIAKTGLAGMGSEAVGQGVGAALTSALARKVGAGAIKVTSGVPEKYGEAVLQDPSILTRAQTPAVMGKAYDAFERYTGLKGLEATLVAGNRATASSTELEGMVLSAANKVSQGAKVDPQELYLASQAASRLKLAARMGEPQAQMAAASAAITQGKGIVDDALEAQFPEYAGLRTGNFESKARAAFGNILPQNKGGTTNVLRPVLAANEAVGAVASGHPGALAALPLMSPAAWGGAIRAGSALSPAAKFLAKYGAAKTAQDAAEGQ